MGWVTSQPSVSINTFFKWIDKKWVSSFPLIAHTILIRTLPFASYNPLRLPHNVRVPPQKPQTTQKTCSYACAQGYMRIPCIFLDQQRVQFMWGLWHQEQVSQAGISNCIPHYPVGCNCLSLPELPAPGAKVLISGIQSFSNDRYRVYTSWKINSFKTVYDMRVHENHFHVYVTPYWGDHVNGFAAECKGLLHRLP